MKNELYYYYNIIVEDIHQINGNYKFYYQGSLYLLVPYTDDISKLDEIYKLHIYVLNMNLYCHEIILNKNNQIITNINKINYLLMKTNVESRNINIRDILLFRKYYIINNSPTNKLTWGMLWSNKVDYLEEQAYKLDDSDLELKSMLYYYIGMAESSIGYFNNNKKNATLCISHKRILKEYTLIDLYNPLNFIVDYNVRDLSEYIKENSETKENEILTTLNQVEIAKDESILLVSRLLFPTYYFDILQKYLLGEITKEVFEFNSNKMSTINSTLIKFVLKIIESNQIEKIEWLLKN